MLNIIKIIVFLIAQLFYYQSSSLKTKFEPIPSKVNLYHNDRSLQQQTNFFAKGKNKKDVFKTTCQIDQTIPIMTFGPQNSQLSAILVCNVHARQLIASELCLSFMKKLRFTKNNKLLKHIQFRIFYRANNQRERVINGQYCLRVNKNGIDINRNFPTGFNDFQTSPGLQTYKGDHPLSENFSKCLMIQVNKKLPNIYLDIHSGQFTLYHQEGINKQKEQQILSEIQSQLCKNCRIKKNQKPDGEIFSDMKIRMKVSYSFLFEVYGGYNANQSQNDNCFSIFNPETKQSKEYYMKKWVNILWKFYEKIIQAQGL